MRPPPKSANERLEDACKPSPSTHCTHLQNGASSAMWRNKPDMLNNTNGFREHAEREGLTQGLHAVVPHLHEIPQKAKPGTESRWWFVGMWGGGAGGEGLTTGNFLLEWPWLQDCAFIKTSSCKLTMGEFYCMQITPPKPVFISCF